MLSWIGTIIFGLVIGLLARFFVPGRQNINLIITAIIGVIGAIIGRYLASLLGVADTGGIDWIRWILSIIVAAIGVYAYGAITKKS